jgi:hypothetical protein
MDFLAYIRFKVLVLGKFFMTAVDEIQLQLLTFTRKVTNIIKYSFVLNLCIFKHVPC